MGLSGRRRARKEGCRSQTSHDACADPVDPADIHDRHRLHRSYNQRTGNTYRRAFPKHAADLKQADLLQFDVSRGFRDDILMPPRPQLGPQDLDSLPNANRYNLKMVRIDGNDYDSSLVYSLKKRNRWRLARSLKANYDSCEELKSQNVFLIESVARGSKSKAGVVKSLTTNALYTRDAANELRDHKKELRAKYHPKKLVQLYENDSFKFSERIGQEKAERPLKKIGIANQKSSINHGSIRHECNLWNHLYNVSQSAEKERTDLQRDYDHRITVTVATTEPCPGVDVKRLHRAEKENQSQRHDRLIKQVGAKVHRTHDGNLAKKMRIDMELQLEMDGSNEDIEETDVFSESEAAPLHRVCELTLVDAMTVNGNISYNRAKKLAKKANKMKKAEAAMLRNTCKQRNNSDQTAVSSGYDSGCESRTDNEIQRELVAEKETVDTRLAETVAAALAVGRPVIQVSRDISDSRRLTELFGANCSTEQALVIGNSEPRKLAILLQADLSECVVFEEVAQHDPQFLSYAINHLCNKVQVPKTSVQEVGSQADPFAFLSSLVSGQSDAAEVAKLAGKTISTVSATASASWRQAAVLTEADARLTALRSLPMFSTAAAIDGDAELVRNAECDICCQQLDADLDLAALRSFAEGNTKLRECGHQFCNRCWMHHVASSISQGRVKITCPGYKCQSALDAATLLWFCPPELLSALTSAAFSAWCTERKNGRSAVHRRFCPRAGCGRLLECRGGVNAVCGACQLGLCLGCGQEPHWPADCATAAKYHKKMQTMGHVMLAKRDFNATIDVNAKQCPACQTLMEKGIGCNHMTCRCGEHFCWWCGQSMRTHATGPCFGEETNRRSQSGYHVQRVFTAQDSFLMPSSLQSRMYCAAVRVRWQRETSPMRLTCTRQKILDMFESYTLRFHNSDCSWPDIKREAMTATQQLIEVTGQASYLVEHSFAHLDSHCRGTGRLTVVFVRAIGGQICHLVEMLTALVQDQCRMGYQGPRQTKLVCDRIFRILHCLRIKCQMLNRVVVNHRDCC